MLKIRIFSLCILLMMVGMIILVSGEILVSGMTEIELLRDADYSGYTITRETDNQLQMNDIEYETKDENTNEKNSDTQVVEETHEETSISIETESMTDIETEPIEIETEIEMDNEPEVTYESEEYIPTITIDRTEEVVSEYRYNITEEEFNEFVRVVEAEVTGTNPFNVSYEEAFKCKLHVAQVILNRVESDLFPDTVHDVIYQRNAFTPLLDGRYYTVDISQVTIEACKAALLASTPDTTNGAQFFSSGTKECSYGYYLFTDEVGHSFFKSYYSD